MAAQIAVGYDTGQGQGYQRIVNLSGKHPPSQVRLRHGDSRGHWEGDTSVVETMNFSSKFTFRAGFGGPVQTERSSNGIGVSTRTRLNTR